MFKIAKLLALSNKIDKKSHKLADKLEKIAANMLDFYVPQSTLESGFKSVGGGNINGSLGGYHTQMEITGGGNIDPIAISEASSLIGELSTDLPPLEQWQQQHPNIVSNPQQVHNILQVWQPFYNAGVTDISQLQSILEMSGPIDLQFATTSPSAAFQSWGITSADILKHEQAHAKGKKSSPEEYMQHAIDNADFMNTNGIDGNINPVKGYYQSLMNNFINNKNPDEYGANLFLWDRIIKNNRPKIN